MCNLYDIGPSSGRRKSGWKAEMAKVIDESDKSYGIRKTDFAIVGTNAPDSGDITSVSMRWGFHRPFNPAINNARSDKINGRMWDDSWNNKQRCVIPVATFYEWSGPAGAKHTHAFQSHSGTLLMAGVWEKNPDDSIGDSFSMLTTAASKQVEAIHNRMPAILFENQIDEYLNAESPLHLLQPFMEELKIFDCENPLKIKAEDHRGPIPIVMLPGF